MPSVSLDSPLVRKSIDTIRLLAADAVEKANSGHPGTPMEAAPIAYLIYTRHLRHNPTNPDWAGRDRFVLSCGHASMLLYSMLHLCGYGRLDLRMRDDGKVFLLEANANPDLTYGEDFAESAESAGIGYDKLVARILNLGLSYEPEWRQYE